MDRLFTVNFDTISVSLLLLSVDSLLPFIMLVRQYNPGQPARSVNGRSPIENGFKTETHRFSSNGSQNTATNRPLRTVLRSELRMPVFRAVANAVYGAF